MINGASSGTSAMSQMAMMRGQRQNQFKNMDANTDGSLDIKELGSMAEKISEASGKSIDAEKMMAKLDTDGDSQVSKEEFKAGRKNGPPGGMKGMMGASGMKAMMKMKGGGMKGNTSQSFMDMLESSESEDSIDPLDTNGDGIVSASESASGISTSIQQYLGEMATGATQSNNTQSLLNLLG
ncbi:EF-hand domain-containing protein [bacterium]|nr:EF-hand domain-containing protein [bacterium]